MFGLNRGGLTLSTLTEEIDTRVADGGEPTPRGRFWHPSVADLVFIGVASAVMGAGSRLTASDGDLGRHLRVGEWIIENWRIPTTDLFSHTMQGEPFVPHEWLSEVLFAIAHRLGGLNGVALLSAAVIALPFALLVRAMHRRGVSLWWLVSFTMLIAVTAMIHALARPHIFTFTFIVLFVTSLDGFRRGERSSVWLLVPLTVLWANLHGAFIVGFVLIGTFWLGWLLERPRSERHGRHLVIVGVSALFAAAVLNPAGPKLIWNSVSYLMSGPLVHLTQEYQSPDFHDWRLWPFLALLLLAVASLGRQPWTIRILVVMWSVFALVSLRNIPIFALACGPFVAEVISSGRDSRPDRGPIRIAGLSILAPVALVVLGVVYGTIRPDHFAYPPDRFPTAAVQEVGPEQLGRVFNEFIWGGYLLYCCWPDTSVFIDGQTDFYGTELTLDYGAAVTGSPEWAHVLDKYHVDSVMIPPERPLAQILSLDNGWDEIYRDETTVVFARGSSGGA